MPGAKHTNLRAVCKRAPFRGQKHTFYTLKGYQTERKSIPFEKNKHEELRDNKIKSGKYLQIPQ
jgi:hypothetical protein